MTFGAFGLDLGTLVVAYSLVKSEMVPATLQFLQKTTQSKSNAKAHPNTQNINFDQYMA